MNFKATLLILIILSIVYNLICFIFNCFIDKTTFAKENNKKTHINCKENITIHVIGFILFLIFCICICKIKFLGNIYNIIYYSIICLTYVSVLINIVTKSQNEKILDRELMSITLIPCFFSMLIFWNSNSPSYDLINSICFDNIFLFILKNLIKYFIITFFFSIDIFLIILKIVEILRFKKKKRKELKKEYMLFKYSNEQKGVRYIFGYIKDIGYIAKLIIYKEFDYVLFTPITFILKIIFNIFKIITNNFLINTIIIKTFNISIILSLLLTYYKLLCFFRDNIYVELYSVVITTIIIPIILNIISDLKNGYAKKDTSLKNSEEK